MTRPVTTDPRAELVDWDVIDLSSGPPVEEWTDDDWEDAVIGTLAIRSREARNDGQGGELVDFEELLAKRGLRMEDLQQA